MESLFDVNQIIEIILEGLSQISGVFDIMIILALIPAIIGGATRSIYKTLLRIVFYAIMLTVAFLTIDYAANFVGDQLLGMIGMQLTNTYDGVTTTYNSLREYLVDILGMSSASSAMVEALTQTTLKNIAWIIVFPIASFSAYLLSTIIWSVGLLFFPKFLKIRIKKTKLRLVNIPLSIVVSLILSVIAIFPYANMSHALSNIVVDPESPIAFLSPHYGGVLAWFTPEKSYILKGLQFIKIPELLTFFDTFKLSGGTTTYQFAQQLEIVLNEVGAITPNG